MKKYLIVLVVVIVFGLFLDTVVNITQLPLILKGVIVLLMFAAFAKYFYVHYTAAYTIISCAIVYLLSMWESMKGGNQFELVESYVLSAFILTIAYMRLTKNGGE
jgi:hypothetical protein